MHYCSPKYISRGEQGFRFFSRLVGRSDPWTGLENSTRPLVFTSSSGCRASENFDISIENYFFPIYANNFCDAGQVPIFRYFEACMEHKMVGHFSEIMGPGIC